MLTWLLSEFFVTISVSLFLGGTSFLEDPFLPFREAMDVTCQCVM